MNLPAKNGLEWAVFGLSALLVLAMVGYLGFEAGTTGDDPPFLLIEPASAEVRGDVLVLPVTITNQGDQTAENVQIVFTLELGAGREAELSLAIELLPRRGSYTTALQVPAEDGPIDAVSWRISSFEEP